MIKKYKIYNIFLNKKYFNNINERVKKNISLNKDNINKNNLNNNLNENLNVNLNENLNANLNKNLNENLNANLNKNLNENLNERKYNLWRWGSKGDNIFSSIKVGEENKLPKKIKNFENKNIENISAGTNHAAFIMDGSIFTYGLNDKGQLGRNIEDKKYSLIPEKINIETKFKKVSCGYKHTLAIDENNELYSWGWGGNFFKGANGLGHGNKENIYFPKKVEIYKIKEKYYKHKMNIIDICCGDQHSLILTNEGKVYSCGRGEFGRLGKGNHVDEVYFEEIDYFTSNNIIIKNISCGHSFSAALSNKGEVYVWGRNDYGQLGIENNIGDLYSHEIYPNKIQYFDVNNIIIKYIACGENHMIASSDNNIIYFWGARTWLEPKVINSNFYNIQKLCTGGNLYYYSMILASNKLYSWGKHNSSCLALKDKKNYNQPTLVNEDLFDGEIICDISCGRGRVLAKTISKQN